MTFDRLADPGYLLARADYDLGWWSGFLGEPRPPQAITAVLANVNRGHADGCWARSGWVGMNTARHLAAQLLGVPVSASVPEASHEPL